MPSRRVLHACIRLPRNEKKMRIIVFMRGSVDNEVHPKFPFPRAIGVDYCVWVFNVDKLKGSTHDLPQNLQRLIYVLLHVRLAREDMPDNPPLIDYEGITSGQQPEGFG